MGTRDWQTSYCGLLHRLTEPKRTIIVIRKLTLRTRTKCQVDNLIITHIYIILLQKNQVGAISVHPDMLPQDPCLVKIHLK